MRVRFAAARFAGLLDNYCLLDNYWRAALIVMKTSRYFTTKRPRSWLFFLAYGDGRASKSLGSIPRVKVVDDQTRPRTRRRQAVLKLALCVPYG